jgi:hypothetical protein
MEIDSRDADELRALEESLWRSDVRYDRARMQAILAPDFFEFGRSGRRWRRDEILDAAPGEIRATLPLPGFAVRWLGAGVAQVTYESRVVHGHGEERSRRSSLWSRTRDGWQLRFHQGTPIPGPT